MKKKKIIIASILSIIMTGLLISIIVMSKLSSDIPVEENKQPTLKVQKEEVEYRDKPIEKEILNNPNNYILIDGVLSNRIMDDDGSYYYLNHNLEGVYNEIGIPFVDVRSNFETRKSLLYAHSTLAGNGPFQALQNYHNNKDYYDNHKYITINYNDKQYNYEIFSVVLSLAEDASSKELEYFYYTEYTDSEWEKAINSYKSKSEYDTGVEVTKKDKIIILQTCSMDPEYYEKYYRYNLLIMAKQI